MAVLSPCKERLVRAPELVEPPVVFADARVGQGDSHLRWPRHQRFGRQLAGSASSPKPRRKRHRHPVHNQGKHSGLRGRLGAHQRHGRHAQLSAEAKAGEGESTILSEPILHVQVGNLGDEFLPSQRCRSAQHDAVAGAAQRDAGATRVTMVMPSSAT